MLAQRRRIGGTTGGGVLGKGAMLRLFEGIMVTKMALRVSYSQCVALRV
jgi:hypothetical protein